jgi:hypothetical protein
MRLIQRISSNSEEDRRSGPGRRGRKAQHIDKVLQSANLKLGSVLSDIMGQSGRTILTAIIAGETRPRWCS